MYEVNPGFFTNLGITIRNKDPAGSIYSENRISLFHFFVFVLRFHLILLKIQTFHPLIKLVF